MHLPIKILEVIDDVGIKRGVNFVANRRVAVPQIKFLQFGITIKFRAFDVEQNILTIKHFHGRVRPNFRADTVDGDISAP